MAPKATPERKPKAAPKAKAAPRTKSAPKAKPAPKTDASGKPTRAKRAAKPAMRPVVPQDPAPSSTTRIVVRPPAARRPSEVAKDGDGKATEGVWSRMAIVTSDQIRKGPRAEPDADSGAARSPLMDTLGHSRAALGNVTTRVQDRLRERTRAQHRVAAIKWAKRAAYVAIGVLAVWLILLSPLFALDTAKVETTGFGTVVDPSEVAVAVAAHKGTSLALLNTTHLANEIREVPGVRAVSIEREWPSGLAISLESREPVAAIPDADGGFILVDDEAIQVGHADEAPAVLPVIEVPLGEDHVRVLKSVLGVVDELPVDVSTRVDIIKAKTEDSVTFTLRDGPRVEWGSAEQSALKAKVLEVLLGSGDADDAEVIDVSAPTLPITSKG